MWTKILLATALIAAAATFSPRSEAAASLEVTEANASAAVGSVDFGMVRIHDFAYRLLRLTNTGDVAIPDLVLQMTGFGFSGRSDCRRVLDPGASCRIDLEFYPQSFGGHSGRLYITGTDVDHTIGLYGWGTQP